MYKIYANNTLIYDDTSNDPYLKVVSPKLTMEVNAAGSLSITIPPGNAGYDTISLMTTDISVTKDGEEIWFGRVLQEEKDFWNNRVLTCEGALAFLNDTTQGHFVYDGAGQQGIIFLLDKFLTEHNERMTDSDQSNRKIDLGIVTVADNTELDCEVNYETTIECINKFILEKTNGYLLVRRLNGLLYLDYLDPKNMVRTNTQKIEFGKNLMDFTTSVDVSEFATVVVPLGKKSGEEGQEEYLTVEDVSQQTRANISDGHDQCADTRFVGFDTAIGSYGWIERVIHFDDCDNADALYSLAWKYLSSVQYGSMELSLSALDLHYLSPEIMSVNLGDMIYVVSPPHGLGVGDSDPLTVLKLEIPMDQPQNTIFQLGSTVKVSLTSSTKKVNTELLEQISNALLDEDKILKAAEANATRIMNRKTTGFITITSDDQGTNEFYIADNRQIFNPNFNKDLPESEDNKRYSAQHFWKWTMNGLGYTDNYGLDYKATITNDGSIVGERIAAGSIHGSKITAGTLSIVTGTGETGLTIEVAPRGSSPVSFEIGDIDSEGKNIWSETTGRTIHKIYIQNGEKIKVTGYAYEVFLYSSDYDFESDYVGYRGMHSAGEYSVQTTGYYRLVLHKPSGTMTNSDLPLMAAAVELSGTKAVITANDLYLIGMVTFVDLEGDPEHPERVTKINGDFISTGHVVADCIDLHGMKITNNDEHSPFYGQISFSVDTLGNVTIGGDVSLSENSVISFSEGDKTIGDISEEASNAEDTANRVAYGASYTVPSGGVVIDGKTYTKSFINGTTIYSPTIIGQDLVAQGENSASKTGSFILKDGSGSERLRIYYTSDTDASPQVQFLANKGQFYFNEHMVIDGGFEDTSTSNSSIYGSLTVRSGGSLIFGNDGKLVLTYGYTWGPLANRPSTNLVAGQLYFQTD